MRKRTLLLCTVCLLLIFSFAVRAQVGFGITEEDRQEFARHRAALYEKIGDQVAVFFGAYERADYQRWRQDSNFYYLTGVEIPYAVLVMDGRDDHTVLYLPPATTESQAMWIGPRLGPGPEAAALFGIGDVRPLQDLASDLPALAYPNHTLAYHDAPEESIAAPPDAFSSFVSTSYPWGWAHTPSRQGTIAAWLRAMIPNVTLVDIHQHIYDLRTVKSAWEIERIEEACRLAALGHIAAIKATRQRAMEYEIEAAATAAFVTGGGFEPAYCAIVGSGPNSAILHYMASSRMAKKGELVLMDYAPSYRYYTADVTRTWPVSGKFTERQRQVYEDVMDIQDRLFATIKPGVSLYDLSASCRSWTEAKGYKYYHSPSHSLGMAVHDTEDYRAPLKAGSVITVEPGIYFPDERWGVRIEDVVVVTQNGCRILSGDAPRDPDEIEALMAENGKKRKK